MRFIIVLLLMALASPALAQAPPEDPQITIYRQLLDNSNAQLVNTAAALIKAQARVKELESKYEPAKPPDKK